MTQDVCADDRNPKVEKEEDRVDALVCTTVKTVHTRNH